MFVPIFSHLFTYVLYFFFIQLQTQDTLSFLVSIKDRVNKNIDSENDNLVTVPITVIVLDENDNPPEFKNVSIINNNTISNNLFYLCLNSC